MSDIHKICPSDVPGLLDGILDGSCVLTGPVEPFIWLARRMVDWQPASSDPP